MRTPAIPEGAQIVASYAEYRELVAAFFRGYFHLLLILGRPGLSKSNEFERGITATSHLIHGWTSPLQAYIECYRHRNKRLIMDDAETLWQRPAGRILMRSLCEHKPYKTVQWLSTARELAAAHVPQKFTTCSCVAIIANQLVFGDEAERAAILDRAHTIYFAPSPREIHLHVGTWFWDQQIYDHIGQRLHLLRDPTARLYTKCWERAQAGGDWQRLIDESFCHDNTTRWVQMVEVDPECPTVTQKVQKFMEQTGACRATYFNLKSKLKEANQLFALNDVDIPKCALQGHAPVKPDVAEEVAKAQNEDETRDARQSGKTVNSAAARSEDEPDAGTTGLSKKCGDKISYKQIPPDNDVANWARRQLADAIEDQDFRRAAKFRDLLERYRQGKE